MTNLRFDGRVAVVTGAGRGMGRAYALMMAARGAKVVVNDYDPAPDGNATEAPAHVVVQEIRDAGGEAIASFDSVITPEGSKAIIQTAVDTFGRVDIVINNAGVTEWLPFAKISYESFRKVTSVHYDGAWLVTQAAWPHMEKQSYGRVLFITSDVAFAGIINNAHYGAAKMAVAGLARMLSFEVGTADIKVNALGVLGYTRQLKEGFFNSEGLADEELPGQLDNERWWIRNVRPDQIAPVAAWLTHESCTLNGDVLDTCAGHTFRHVLSSTQGYTNVGLTPEDVAANIDRIMDTTDSIIWRDVGEACQWRLQKALEAGAEPMPSAVTEAV